MAESCLRPRAAFRLTESALFEGVAQLCSPGSGRARGVAVAVYCTPITCKEIALCAGEGGHRYRRDGDFSGRLFSAEQQYSCFNSDLIRDHDRNGFHRTVTYTPPPPDSPNPNPIQAPAPLLPAPGPNPTEPPAPPPPPPAPAPPAGATALCGDGSYSFSQHHPGTCSAPRRRSTVAVGEPLSRYNTRTGDDSPRSGADCSDLASLWRPQIKTARFTLNPARGRKQYAICLN